jgi:uncharacterized protein YbgA (DUF1722 family)
VLFAHSPRHCHYLGSLVARGKAMPLAAVYSEYGRALQEALQLEATRAKHVRCMQHILSYGKKTLSSEAKQELLTSITAYRQGECLRSAPLALINHYVHLFEQPFLTAQYYLNPHPLEL